MIGIKLTLPIRTRSPNGGNPGTRWAAIARSREKRQHKDVAHMAVAAALKARGVAGADLVPVLVRLVRVSPGVMDDDNVQFALKATRDGIARALGIDDGDRARLRFLYGQRKGPKGKHAVEILIERGAA